MSIKKSTDQNNENEKNEIGKDNLNNPRPEEPIEKIPDEVPAQEPESNPHTQKIETIEEGKAEEVVLTPEILKLINQEVAKATAAMGPRVPNQIKEIYQESELPVDDYLDIPTTYFAFSKYYALWGDKRQGQHVATPYNKKIEFDALYRFNRNNVAGKGIEVVTISQAVIRSKKEDEWLQNHSLFGIKFFKNMNDATNVDVTLSEKMAEMQSMISGMDDMKVVERAKMEGVNVKNPDIQKIRQELVQKLAYQAMTKERQRSKQTLEEYEEGKIEVKKVETAGNAQEPFN